MSTALDLYYRHIQDTRMLSAEEERNLIKDYQTTGSIKSRDLVLEGALRYVISLAVKNARWYKNNTALEDFICAGNVGLLRAIEKFNTEHGTRFLTYASWWVRYEMHVERRRLSMIDIPEHAAAKGVKTPPLTEFEEYYIQPDASNEAIQEVHHRQSIAQLLSLTRMSVRETFIVKSCYGINTAPRTLKQVGKILYITGERVRQLREGALQKLRRSAVTHAISND